MSTQYQTAAGAWHVQVKLYGDERKIKLFHAILREIETDWVFHNKYNYPNHYLRRIKVCPRCKGIVLTNTRLAPSDIKAAAAQVGIGCKIYNFAKEARCGEPKDRGVFEYVESKYASVLYSHKPKRINIAEGCAWVGSEPPSPEAKVITLPYVAETVQ
jgi:hypothetical protein